jgi:hypothetical protein
MNVSPPGNPDAREQDVKAIHVDHSQGTQVGDYGIQDNRFMPVVGRGALMAGRDLHVQDLHVHVESVGGGSSGKVRPDAAIVPVLPAVTRSAYLVWAIT